MSKKQSLIGGQIFIHRPQPLQSKSSSSTSLNNRRPLLQRHSNSASSNSSSCSGRFAELAGGTTAECAAVCCCCPCALVNLLYLTIYKVPTGLWRRALRRKRRKQLIKKGLLPPRTKRCRCGCDETVIEIHPSASAHELMALKSDSEESSSSEGEEEAAAMVKLEKEMWETFYSTGFWRSPSQREAPGMSHLHRDSPKAKVKK